MQKFLVLIFGICILNVQCAVYGYADEHLHRQVRSPHYGGAIFGPPPPPPPPFIYHTHNWSGVSRGYGGRSNGVFSGATAAAGSAPPTNGEAVALATADASSGQAGSCDDATSGHLDQSGQYASKSGQFNSKSIESGSIQYGGKIKSSGSDFAGSHSGSLQGGFSQSNGFTGSGSSGGAPGASGSSDFGGQLGEFKSHSSGFASSANTGQQNNRLHGHASENSAGFSGSNGDFQGAQYYKEAHFSSEGHGGQLEAQQSNADFTNQGSLAGNQQAEFKKFSNSQSQSSSFGNAGLGGNKQAPSVSQGQFNGGDSGISSGFAYGNHGHGNSNYKNGHEQSQQLQSGESFGQSARGASGLASGSQDGASFGASGASRGDAYSAFNGALELASQGLQAADKAGCSTCQKSSYALSNAKSYNGNAISLAIGG